MGVILGTVPGWEQDSDWSSDNRVYIAPGYAKADIPDTIIEKGKGYKYRMNINIEVYIYDSPCDCDIIIVTRKINNVNIIGIYEKEYPGGLEQWVKDLSDAEARELVTRTVEEMAGPPECTECEQYDIHINSKEYIPPTIVPENIIEMLVYYLEQLIYFKERIKELEEEYNFNIKELDDERIKDKLKQQQI